VFSVLGYNSANLALNKPSSQVSTYSSAVASLANDGDGITSSCTHASMHPYWAVDLGAAHDIGHVIVTNDDNPNFGDTTAKLFVANNELI